MSVRPAEWDEFSTLKAELEERKDDPEALRTHIASNPAFTSVAWEKVRRSCCK